MCTKWDCAQKSFKNSYKIKKLATSPILPLPCTFVSVLALVTTEWVLEFDNHIHLHLHSQSINHRTLLIVGEESCFRPNPVCDLSDSRQVQGVSW